MKRDLQGRKGIRDCKVENKGVGMKFRRRIWVGGNKGE